MPVALQLLLGWVLLWKGGDFLVDGTDRFARGRGLPASLAGVFILGFGTSAPELATTVVAAARGLSGIAAGNVVGSNIANVGLILGTAVVLRAVRVDRFLLRVEMPLAIAASVLAYLLCRDGTLTTVEGGVLVAAFAGYTVFAAGTARRRPPPPPTTAEHRPVLELATALLGMGGVVLGAHVFLEGAISVATSLGVSHTVIGVSLVALGTSLPELATTWAAVRTDRMELAVGNVVGSNIFNVLLVLGVAGLITPQRPDARLAAIDFPFMLGTAVLCWALAARGGRYRRGAGVLLLATYAGYLAVVALTR